jgi:hypothetical protein
LDGYVIADSDDEGAHLRPLTNFAEVQGVKNCVAEACTDLCAYYANIELWPRAVCGEPSEPPDAGKPADPVSEAGAGGAGGNATDDGNDAGASGADTGGVGGAEAGEPSQSGSSGAAGGVDESGGRSGVSASDGGCACDLMARRPAAAWTWLFFGLLLVSRIGRRGARRVRFP